MAAGEPAPSRRPLLSGCTEFPLSDEQEILACIPVNEHGDELEDASACSQTLVLGLADGSYPIGRNVRELVPETLELLAHLAPKNLLFHLLIRF
jgi:hypothetical protein